ncbi:Lar family restriction alleviation protein [Comamonas sp. F1-6]|uniref:Lar family restriction alleviation protein n=1 Tax=Comamonas sp. F1-6 TaxID=673550 RepID=UPI0031CE49CB
MSSTTKLLPCPFCSNADISIKNENPKDNSGGYFIECPGCGASTSLRFACGDDPTYLLAEQWNRRTTSHCLHQIQEPDTGLQQLIAEIDQHMRAEWNAGRLPAESWPTTLASRVSAAVAGSAATAHAAKPTQHPDDAAVDDLATLMKAKLAKQRDKGYGGWDTDCTRERLSELLRGHVEKGDPVDVANFCAFLSARCEGIAPLEQADAQDAESDYQRGYRHGYNRRDAEVQGALL